MGVENFATKHKNTINAFGIIFSGAMLALSAGMLFLATETLHASRKATEARIFFDYYMSEYQMVLDIYRDSAFKEFVTKAGSRKMSHSDLLKSATMLVTLLGTYEVGFILNKDGYISDDNWAKTRKEICDLANKPGVKGNWQVLRSEYHPDFRGFVDRCLPSR